MNTEFEKQNIFGLGPENTAFAQYFIGKSYLKPLVEPHLRGWERLVSGGRKTGAEPWPR